MKEELLEATYELVGEIKDTDTYRRLLQLKKIIEDSMKITALIENFQNCNKAYEELKKYGSYHPNVKKAQIAFSKAKHDLYTNEIVREYKQLELALQQQLDTISTTIAKSISNKIKHPNEVGLVQK